VIDRIATVCIFVSNQDRARDFYTRVLGFELRDDQPLYPGAQNRWLAVAPPGAATEVILYLADEHWQHYRQVVGQSQAVTFNVTDMDALYRDLVAKGVTFTEKPARQPWGTYATILDSEGNRLILVQPPTGVRLM
jgi:lactoylglutathione lyase